MNTGGKYNTPNRLWIARKRRGLGQKQVAYLLNHHTTDQISRYEKGLRMPTLETALTLEIIYRTPLRMLYKEMYEQLQQAVGERVIGMRSLRSVADKSSIDETNLQHFCAYEDILKMPSPSQADLAEVRRHVVFLARKLAYL